MGSGTIFKSVTKEDIHSIDFLLPPVSLNIRFKQIVEPLFKSVANLTSRNENLRQTRDLLLPRLISGELDVAGLQVSMGVEEVVEGTGE